MASPSPIQQTPAIPSAEEHSLSDDISLLSKDLAESICCQELLDSEGAALDNTIENLLMRLDEFAAQAGFINSSASTLAGKVIPHLFTTAKQLEVLYAQVYAMEQMVASVKAVVDKAEAEVTEVEDSQSSTIRKFIPSFFLKKQPEPVKKKINPQDFQIDVDGLLNRVRTAQPPSIPPSQ